jgi:hypothetical protein
MFEDPKCVCLFHVENAGFSKYTSTFIRALWAAEKKICPVTFFQVDELWQKKISQSTTAAIDT